MRGRTKEIVTAVAQSAKAISAVASDVASIGAQIGRIRETNVQNADAIASITGALMDARGLSSQPVGARVEKA